MSPTLCRLSYKEPIPHQENTALQATLFSKNLPAPCSLPPAPRFFPCALRQAFAESFAKASDSEESYGLQSLNGFQLPVPDNRYITYLEFNSKTVHLHYDQT